MLEEITYKLNELYDFKIEYVITKCCYLMHTILPNDTMEISPCSRKYEFCVSKIRILCKCSKTLYIVKLVFGKVENVESDNVVFRVIKNSRDYAKIS